MSTYSTIVMDDYAKPPSEVTKEELDNLNYEDFVSRATTLREVEDVSQWLQGDLYAAFESKYASTEEKTDFIAQFSSDIGKSVSTVKQYAWVSKKFPLRSQRDTGLSWSHYRRAAGMDDPMKWINKSVTENWTVAKLIEETQQEQDKISVACGRPCDNCGCPLPDNSLHIRRGKSKWCSCDWKCLLELGLKMDKLEELEEVA